MNIEFFATFDDDQLSLALSLPIEFLDKNLDEYTFLENKIIYKSNNLDIDFDILNKNLEIISKRLINSFYDKKTVDNNKHIKIYISDSENNENAFNFIKKYKNLEIAFDVNDFKEIIDNLKDYEYPNLKINFKNSYESISYKEFYDMYCKLNEIVEFINHYNLSPLEKVLLVYDIVKSNEYKKETKNETYGTSRNLNEIINNDKIVCVGFANLIDFLLKNLEIKSNTMILGYKNKNVQHERNYIYLKDDKYKIDGMFFLDATWDSKNDDKYLDNYICFLKPFKFFKVFKNDEYVVSPTKFQTLEKNKEDLISYIKELKGFELIKLSLTLSQLIKEYNPDI